MTRVELHLEAQSELEEAHSWYKGRSELVGSAFLAEVFRFG
jgi:hypothetical protein